jgi:VanZ family protein
MPKHIALALPAPIMTIRSLLHRLRQIDSWLIAPALLVVIYGELAHNPLGQLEVHVWDKLLHFTAYFGLSLMATIAVRADRRVLWWAIGLVALGGVLEIVQGMTGRDCDIYDELANAIGVLVGSGLGWTAIRLLKARKILEDDILEDGPPPSG